ncbi:hypothetical protein HDV03_001333 [Kappamyces sp. JEL0829]|nr:hypothetical protein HDV03_001333 [Kappamyces sp. JEL0829]
MSIFSSAFLDVKTAAKATEILLERIGESVKSDADFTDWLQFRYELGLTPQVAQTPAADARAGLELKYAKEFEGMAQKRVLEWPGLKEQVAAKAQAHQNAASALSALASRVSAWISAHPEWAKAVKAFESLSKTSIWKPSTSLLDAKYETVFLKLTKELLDKQAKHQKLVDKPTVSGLGSTLTVPDKGEKKLQAAAEDLETASVRWIAEGTSVFDRMETMERDRLEFLSGILKEYTNVEMGFHHELGIACAALDQATMTLSPERHLANFASAKAVNASFVPPVPVDQAGSAPGAQVDEAGYSVKPNRADDPFKLKPDYSFEDGDNEASDTVPKVLNVAIKKAAIVDDEEASVSALQSVSAQLASDENVNKRGTRSRIPSAVSEPVKPYVSSPSGILGTQKAYATSLPPLSGVEEVDVPQASELSVVESVNVYQVDLAVDKLLITGEVSMRVGAFAADTILKLAPWDALEKVVENPAFVQATGVEGEYRLLTELIGAYIGTTILLFKYQVNTLGSKDDFVPIFLSPNWQITPDSANLLIRYKMNNYFLQPYRIDELKVVACLKGDQNVGQVQTQPVASWDLDNRTLIWDLHDRASSSEAEGMMVAKIETSGGEPDPVLVSLSLSQGLVSGLEISGGGDLLVIKTKQVVSGTFCAESRMVL